jgi:hypothetical protein
MTTFDEREKDFENKYAHDKKIDFNVEARTSKLFGLWVAGKLGLSGDDAAKYALEVVGANLEEAGFDDVLRKVGKDLAAKNIDISKHMLEVELEKHLAEAKQQVFKDGR